MFTKQDLIKTLVIVYIVGSVIYIGWDSWHNYQVNGVQAAYQAGATDTVKQILDKSTADQCKSGVPITLAGTTTQFVDVKCLQQPQAQAGANGATPAAGAATTPAKK